MKASVVVVTAVLAMLVSYGEANCGCLKCSKNLFVASPPGVPVKVISRRGPGGIQTQNCENVISKPCSVNVQAALPLPLPLLISQVPAAACSYLPMNQYQVLPSYGPSVAYQPHVPNTYEVNEQTPVAIPALVKDVCVPKPIKAVARVVRIVMPAPAPPSPTVYTRPLLSLLPGQYPIMQRGCAPAKTVIPEVRPIGTPIIETLVPVACAPCSYSCRYAHLQTSLHPITSQQQCTNTHQGKWNVDNNLLTHLDRTLLDNSPTVSRSKRSVQHTDAILSSDKQNVNIKMRTKVRGKRHIPLISSGINLLMGLLPSFIRAPIHQGLRNVKKHVDRTLADQRKRRTHLNSYSQKMSKMYNPQVVARQSGHRQTPYHSQLREFPRRYPGNTPFHPNDDLERNMRHMQDLQDNFISSLKQPNYIPKISLRSKDAESKTQHLTKGTAKPSKLFDNLKRRSKKGMTPEEKEIFLKKLQKLNGASRRYKRSLVLDTSDISLPFFRVTRTPTNEIEKSVEEYSEEEETSGEEGYSEEHFQEEPSEKMSHYREHHQPYEEKHEERLLEPLDFSQMIPHNPIFYLLNTPIRLLQYVHSIRKQIVPILKSVPQVLVNSKKYLKNFGKSFHSEILDMASNAIGDFDNDPRHYNSWHNVVSPSRYRRSLQNTDEFNNSTSNSTNTPILDANNGGTFPKDTDNPDKRQDSESAVQVADYDEKEDRGTVGVNNSVELRREHRHKNFISVSGQEEPASDHSDLSDLSREIHTVLETVLQGINKTRNMFGESLNSYPNSVGSTIKKSPLQLFCLILEKILEQEKSCSESDRRKLDHFHERLENRPSITGDNIENRFRDGDFRPEYSIVFQTDKSDSNSAEDERISNLNDFQDVRKDDNNVSVTSMMNGETSDEGSDLKKIHHTRRKRYILKMVNEDDVETYIKETLGNLMSPGESRVKSTRKGCKNCHKHHAEEVTAKKPEKKKYVVEKLYPRLIIDNKGMPFIELDGHKRPLSFKKKKSQRLSEHSCETCREKRNNNEESRESEEEASSSEGMNLESRISNLIETARQHVGSHPKKYNDNNEDEDSDDDDDDRVSQYADLPSQVIKERIAQTLADVQNLITMDFDRYTSIYGELSRLEQLKETVSEEWKQLVITDKVNDISCKIRLLDYFKKLQVNKDEVVESIAEALKCGNNFMTKKLTKILVRLQKLQCIIYRVVEDAEERIKRNTNFDVRKEIKYIDYLSSLKFVVGRSRGDLEDDLKKERDEAVERSMEVVDNLRQLLELQDDCYVIKEEARLLWEIKNLEKLQQDTINALNNKFQRKQKIRKELKILFDLLRQTESNEENQAKLFEKLRNVERADNDGHYFEYGIPRIENRMRQNTIYNNMEFEGKEGVNDVGDFIVNSKSAKRMRNAVKPTEKYHTILEDKQPIKIVTNGYTLTGYKVSDGFD